MWPPRCIGFGRATNVPLGNKSAFEIEKEIAKKQYEIDMLKLELKYGKQEENKDTKIGFNTL